MTWSKRLGVTRNDDGGYVHDPSQFEDAREGSAAESQPEDDDAESWADKPVHPDSVDREFDWRGWVLVGVIFFAFIIAPLAILLWPPGEDFQISYLFALLILPLLPAVLLALTAVWATTRP